jgi:hypothetical protein
MLIKKELIFMGFFRVGMSYTFVRLARKNYKLMMTCKEQLEVHREVVADINVYNEKMERMYERSKIEFKLDEYVLNTIIFSALSVEAYIYDYAARNLTDSFVKEHLDKLDIVSKWIIIPRLITGKTISKGEKAYCLLKNLISVRNSIVHNKSVNVSSKNQIEVYENINKKEIKYLKTASDVLNTLDALAEKIEEFDPNEHAKIWFNYKGKNNGEFDDI